ncbi:hypothetical protein Ancab_037012, partial [Ancistrocladus abbreviatus]
MLKVKAATGKGVAWLVKKLTKLQPCGRLSSEDYLPVYVRDDQRWWRKLLVYMVPVECLSSTMFKALINQCYDEERSKGGKIILVCSPTMFEWVLSLSLDFVSDHFEDHILRELVKERGQKWPKLRIRPGCFVC